MTNSLLRAYKGKRITCMEGFPIDIVRTIMTKLDATSLARCRTIRKQWDLVITEPLFISALPKCLMEVSRHNILFVCQSINTHARPNMMNFTAMDLQNEETRVISRGVNETVDILQVHKLLPITCDLICLKRLQSVRILNPTSGEKYELRLPFHPLFHSNWEASFGLNVELGQYSFMSLVKCSNYTMEAMRLSWPIDQKLSPKIVIWRSIQQTCPRILEQGISVGNNFYWPIDNPLP
ncbi:OLC1v1018553C1 [Oldenlandia corymbosa var. corymbosa]|uniref:OLC1v1018553C1 n=1 Tax=Oldenlandia corymbosa var. corymbosa TaxID=529605 RepID=A0AAV1EBX1_OLDCO|nr:OLC1v1018553C1 [Oldenlandia corymbosa var. corymbosa]